MMLVASHFLTVLPHYNMKVAMSLKIRLNEIKCMSN